MITFGEELVAITIVIKDEKPSDNAIGTPIIISKKKDKINKHTQIKNGFDSKDKVSNDANAFCMITFREELVAITIVIKDEKPSDNAIGTPIIMSKKKDKNNTNTVIAYPPHPYSNLHD